jgi:MFS family permease
VSSPQHRNIRIAVVVAALGYFVDVYDLVLFSIVRVDSLKSLGLATEEITSTGVTLLNTQMIGMLLGGLLWGLLGDKFGRIQVLFGSILLYSLANIANAFISTTEEYLICRFLAGVGLAGEIGAGITLVSELMPRQSRGLGTTIVATVGVSGAIAAALVGDMTTWRTAYIIGGVMGLTLLVLRVSVSESGIFSSIRANSEVARGDIRMLFNSRERFVRFISCVLSGVPIWYVAAILVTFSPEIGVALDITEPLRGSRSILFLYIGLTAGDLISGLLSHLIKSRKKAIGAFLLLNVPLVLILLNSKGRNSDFYYSMITAIGFFTGYWAVFISTAAEQFGTNLRATVATSVPNFVRGFVVPITIAFEYLKGPFGVVGSAQTVGLVTFVLAGLALLKMRETFGVDLDYLEKDH